MGSASCAQVRTEHESHAARQGQQGYGSRGDADRASVGGDGTIQWELVKAGIVLVGEGLMPSSTGVRVRFSGKDRIVTDGPFAETKELVAGYSIWQVKSMEEAVSWAKRCPLTDGDLEIRPIFSYSPEEVSEIVSQAK